ncbi:hypothetical protein BC828DRAFT_382338 [Blastocladiella britannica]|nr:hypothetical protein BC828DRAFT_382338 [Blastocladiella britannica]
MFKILHPTATADVVLSALFDSGGCWWAGPELCVPAATVPGRRGSGSGGARGTVTGPAPDRQCPQPIPTAIGQAHWAVLRGRTDRRSTSAPRRGRPDYGASVHGHLRVARDTTRVQHHLHCGRRHSCCSQGGNFL